MILIFICVARVFRFAEIQRERVQEYQSKAKQARQGALNARRTGLDVVMQDADKSTHKRTASSRGASSRGTSSRGGAHIRASPAAHVATRRGMHRGRGGRGALRGRGTGRGRGAGRKPLSQEQMDRDLDKYFMKDEHHAKEKLDADMDAYMADA